MTDEKHKVWCERSMKLRHRRDAAGACVSCGKARDTALKNCSSCVAKRIEVKRATRKRRFLARICIYCGKAKPSGSFAGCEPCLAKANASTLRTRSKKRATP